LTNRNLKALNQIGTPISDLSGYGALIDSLYFLFHVGVADRLRGSKPDSFSDTNALRTDLRRDLDHGGEAKSRSKKRKLGTTFAKYGGEGTPESLNATLFPLVQSKLLTSIKNDLEAFFPRVFRSVNPKELVRLLSGERFFDSAALGKQPASLNTKGFPSLADEPGRRRFCARPRVRGRHCGCSY
jgi:hypothetical protein